jgi:hypothetical protein
MQRIIVITLIALITGGSIAAAQLVERYSNNPLPKLNIVGIGMAEDLTTAKNVVGEIFKNKMNIPVPDTCRLDVQEAEIAKRVQYIVWRKERFGQGVFCRSRFGAGT